MIATADLFVRLCYRGAFPAAFAFAAAATSCCLSHSLMIDRTVVWMLSEPSSFTRRSP